MKRGTRAIHPSSNIDSERTFRRGTRAIHPSINNGNSQGPRTIHSSVSYGNGQDNLSSNIQEEGND